MNASTGGPTVYVTQARAVNLVVAVMTTLVAAEDVERSHLCREVGRRFSLLLSFGSIDRGQMHHIQSSNMCEAMILTHLIDTDQGHASVLLASRATTANTAIIDLDRNHFSVQKMLFTPSLRANSIGVFFT